MKDLVH